MDLSSHGNTQPFRQKLTHECPVMIGTVPVLSAIFSAEDIEAECKELKALTEQIIYSNSTF